MTKLFINICTCIFLIFYSQVVAAISEPDRFSLENYKSIWEHDVQLEYRILDNVALISRYDKSISSLDDKNGEKFSALTGGFLPAHMMFNQDITVGMNWNISSSWLLKTEYHRRRGSSRVSALDNPDMTKLELNSNIYALQISFRF